MLLVRSEESVVDEIAVIANDVAGRPHRVDDLQVGLCRESEGASTSLSVDGGHPECRCCHRGGRASEDLPTSDAVHLGSQGGDGDLRKGRSRPILQWLTPFLKPFPEQSSPARAT